jgi:hypothetical protein
MSMGTYGGVSTQRLRRHLGIVSLPAVSALSVAPHAFFFASAVILRVPAGPWPLARSPHIAFYFNDGSRSTGIPWSPLPGIHVRL